MIVGGDFHLTDHDGHAVTTASYRGKVVLLFFGFTHCKVICPKALAALSLLLDELAEPLRVAALYVTVDPARDTPEVMRAFLRPAHPHFVGLTGTPEEIDAVKSAYRVFAERRDEPDGNYAVPHSALVHVLDPAGTHVAHWPVQLPVPEMLARMRALLVA